MGDFGFSLESLKLLRNINPKDCTVKRMDGSSFGSPQSVFKHQQRLIHLLKEVEEALVYGNLLGGVLERVLLPIREGGGAPGDEIFERIKMGFDGSVKCLLNVEIYVTAVLQI